MGGSLDVGPWMAFSGTGGTGMLAKVSSNIGSVFSFFFSSAMVNTPQQKNAYVNADGHEGLHS